MKNYCSGLIFGLFILAAAMPLSASAQDKALVKMVLPTSAVEWSEAAQLDVNAAYQETYDNHPGIYDVNNPDFRKHLTRAKEQGLLFAAKVTDAAGYKAAIERFSVTLQDGHAGAFTNLDQKILPALRWPGFVSVWRGDSLYVYASEPGGPQVGSKITGCDGMNMPDLVMKNVFSFRGISTEPGQWWVRARQVFYDNGNPFVDLPKTCRFVFEGREDLHTLAWQASNENFDQWTSISYNGDALPIGMTEPRARLLWVAMPSFQPNEKERDAYRKLFSDIKKKRRRVLNSDALVIDLRHNQGGSSLWSLQFAQALWGSDRVLRRMSAYAQKLEVWWRASKENLAHVGWMIATLQEQKQPEGVAYFDAIYPNLQASLARGETYYAPSEEAVRTAAQLKPADPKIDRQGDPAAFTKPVYVIVPGQCASACLDALDVFTLFPNTKLIGAPSAADSTYMEVRVKALPSGMAQVIIPNKMYVNRPRGAGQSYSPAIAVTEIVWSTGNLLKVVETDLRLKK